MARFFLQLLLPVFTALLLLPTTGRCTENTDPFPIFPALQKNIAFWEKVYSAYPSSQGLLHDKEDLSIIYTTIALVDDQQPGARKRNRARIKAAKAEIERILLKLGQGEPAATAEERRIQALFGDNVPPKRYQQAARDIRFQRCLKDRFAAGIVRSGRYLGRMRRIFSDYGLPADLAYLPHVESSFNYQAYSKFGAAGIWQFTRGTGKRFLTINYTLDERRDPLRATQAAARYLKENYALLGSWPLAITAYNHGEAGMLRAKEQFGNFQQIFHHYDGRRFKFASKNFYAEFLAARNIARAPERYFGPLVPDPPLVYNTYALPGYIPATELCQYFKINQQTLRALNPALRPPVFSGRKYLPKGYRLCLPKSIDPDLLAQSLPESLLRSSQKRSRFYRVQRGDTAGAIARAHNIPLRDLILANALDSRATVYVGQNLRLPLPGEKAVVLALAGKQRPQTAKAGPTAPKTAAPPIPVAAQPSTTVATRTAAPIVAQSPPSRSAPSPAPAAPRGTPSPGARSAATAVQPEVVVGNLEVTETFSKNGKPYGRIQVLAGETLGHYADWLEIPTRELRRLNRLRFGTPVHIDQTLVIPLAQIDRETFTERRYEYHKEIEEDFFAAYQVVDLTTYAVQRGDTIWELCREKLELPIWLLQKYNTDLDLDHLRADQQLIVPQLTAQG